MEAELDWGYRQINLLDRLEEIDRALDAKLYQAALALALSVPDICGMIESNATRTSGVLYAQWFDKHVSHNYLCFKNEIGEFDPNRRTFNGNICYKLRCAFLHSGNDEIKSSGLLSIPENEQASYDLEYKLILNTDSGNSLFCGTDKAIMSRQYTVNINIPKLCNNICDAARSMMDSWPSKSDFNEHSYLLYSSQKWHEDEKAFEESL